MSNIVFFWVLLVCGLLNSFFWPNPLNAFVAGFDLAAALHCLLEYSCERLEA